MDRVESVEQRGAESEPGVDEDACRRWRSRRRRCRPRPARPRSAVTEDQVVAVVALDLVVAEPAVDDVAEPGGSILVGWFRSVALEVGARRTRCPRSRCCGRRPGSVCVAGWAPLPWPKIRSLPASPCSTSPPLMSVGDHRSAGESGRRTARSAPGRRRASGRLRLTSALSPVIQSSPVPPLIERLALVEQAVADPVAVDDAIVGRAAADEVVVVGVAGDRVVCRCCPRRSRSPSSPASCRRRSGRRSSPARRRRSSTVSPPPVPGLAPEVPSPRRTA